MATGRSDNSKSEPAAGDAARTRGGSTPTVRRLEREIAIYGRIAEIFVRVPDEQMYGEVLGVVLKAMESKYGVFGYLDDAGDLVVPSMTQEIWDECRVEDKRFVFRRDTWGDSSWPRAVRGKRTICLNEPSTKTPPGHIAIRRHIAAPVIHRDRVVGLFQVANKETDYDQEDIQLLAGIACRVAPILSARLQRDRQERQRKESDMALKRIEWLLTKKSRTEVEAGWGEPAYGDLVRQNTCREVADAVGAEILHTLVGDFLSLLDTSAAVHEKNGDYAAGIFASGWCRLLDQASRNRCGTSDNRQALECGKWLCHESCWTDASKVSIETGQPVDVPCAGGLRLFAAPIRAGEEIVGSINLGYGDPPTDPGRLREIAVKFGVDADELIEQATLYKSRPPYVIDLAKKRLLMMAELIGALVARARAEEAARAAQRQLLAQHQQERQRVQAELGRVRDELVRTAKLAAIGQVSASIAHELRNPLGAMRNAAYYLQKHLPPDVPKAGQFLGIIEEEVQSANQIITNLLEVGQARVPAKQPTDLAALTEEAMRECRHGDAVRWCLTLVPEPFEVEADLALLRHVFVNLVQNAIDAMEGEGLLTIRASRNQDADTILFEDTGPGVPTDRRDQVFEPLVTTKAKGVGMGLAICRQIVECHGGTIDIVDGETGGAAVRVRLPPK